MKKKIIIVGYPKSGNTWLTRLTAEAVGCPVTGFWGQPDNKDIAIEGQNRVSVFECYKAHHDYNLLMESFEHTEVNPAKIIYIVRDPRDVAISAYHYFGNPPKYPIVNRILQKFKMGRLYNHYHKFFHGQKPTTIVNALVDGIQEKAWINVSWNNHVQSYLDADIFYVKYEDLLEEPVIQVKRILEYLDIEKDHQKIGTAVKNQSFEVRKKEFEKTDKQKAAFLRKGRSGQWKKGLDRKKIQLIEQKCGDTMKRLGYL